MKKITTIITSIVIAAASLVSCNDLKDIEDRVDSLESRVQALENVCKTMNGNIVALQTFLEGKKAINSFTEKDGIYTIILSDGSKLTLAQGSEGAPSMPDIAIDKNGYWTLDGEQILSNGKPVQATGKDGATPIFGVDKDGYWTVRYSEGETPKQVLDVNGEPVKAVNDAPGSEGSNDKFFENIEVLEGKIEITLKGGQKYSLPVVPDFLCAIQGIELQPVMFNLGEKKTFTVTMKNVAQTMLQAPAQWNASLTDNILTIEAPKVLTKVSADTRQDVSVLAISNTGFSAISKVRVQLYDSPIIETPTASVVAGEATQGSLTYTISLSNTTEWFYMLKKSTETEPTAEELRAATKGGQELTITLSTDNTGANLSVSTEYTLYILPVNTTGEGSIASAKNTTLEKTYTTLMEKYNDGKDIVIAGKTYNKSVYGEAGHITKESPEIDKSWDGTETSAPKIFFVDTDANAKYTFTGATTNMIIIGNDPAKRSPLSTAIQIKLNQKTEPGEFVMSGIDFNSSSLTNYPFVQNYEGAFSYLCLDNCHIKLFDGKHITYISKNTRSYETFAMNRCEFEVSAKSNIINVGGSTAVYQRLIFTDNIFYNPEDNIIEDFRLFNGKSAKLGTVTLNNNTFVNLHTSTASSSDGAISTAGISVFECSKNLIFTTKAMSKHCMLLRVADDTSFPESGEKIKDNIVYKGTGNDSWNFQIVFGGKGKIPGSEETVTIKDNPFEGGTFDISKCQFTPNNTYAGYGAQR